MLRFLMYDMDVAMLHDQTLTRRYVLRYHERDVGKEKCNVFHLWAPSLARYPLQA